MQSHALNLQDFLQDGGLLSPPCTAASKNAAPELFTRQDDVDKAHTNETLSQQQNPNDFDHRVHNTERWSQPSGHKQTQLNSLPAFKMQTETERSSHIEKSLPNTLSCAKVPQKCSPATSSLERLKSFAFVKTRDTNRRRRPNADSTLIPPSKRRTVCDDTTNTSENEPFTTLSAKEGGSRSRGIDPGHAVAKEIGNESHDDVASGSHPIELTTPTKDGKCDRFEFNFDTFLDKTDISDSDASSLLLTTEATTPSPSPFKPPTHNPRKASSMHHSTCSKTKITSSSQTCQMPQKLISHTSFSQQTSRASTVAPATPQTTLSAIHTPRSSVALLTPKGRQTAQALGTPSLTTPTRRTPILVHPSRRKFPGPAGLLPPLVSVQSDINIDGR